MPQPEYPVVAVEHTVCCVPHKALCGEYEPEEWTERKEQCLTCQRIDNSGAACGDSRCPYRPLWRRILWPSRTDRQ